MNHKDAKHFTWDQRLTLERMLQKGFTKAAIASALGKCERSIYYEINRGLCVQQTSEYEFIEVYCPEVAERKYRDFLKDKGRDLKIGKDHALARRLDPQAAGELYEILARLRGEQGMTVVMVSHDLGTALGYASHVLYLDHGQGFFGTRGSFLTEHPEGRRAQ